MREIQDKKNTTNTNAKACLTYAIGSGKGGTGKSFFTSNLAFNFSKHNLKTLIVDLDFEASNIHTYLEMPEQKYSLFDYLNGKMNNLKNIVQKTSYKNLSIITAQSCEYRNLTNSVKLNSALDVDLDIKKFFENIRSLGFDRVFFDLGPGSRPLAINSFLEADYKIAVTTAEPTSVENLHFFLKKTFSSYLNTLCKKHEFLNELISIQKKKDSLKLKNPSDFIKHLKNNCGDEGLKIALKLEAISPLFIINQCRTPMDFKLGQSLAQASRRYYSFNTSCLGHLSYDEKVWQSIRSMQPLLLSYPQSHVLNELDIIYKNLKYIEKNSNQAYALAS